MYVPQSFQPLYDELAPSPNFVVLITANSGTSNPTPPTVPIRLPSAHPMADNIWNPTFDPSIFGAA